MKPEHKEIAEKFARLIDSVNRLMFFGALAVFYFWITPVLYRIEKADTTTAIQVESSNTKLDSLDYKVQKATERIELWQEKKKTSPP